MGTLRRECLDHLIIVNERHLRSVLTEFVRHYNETRPHRALALEVPLEAERPPPSGNGRVIRRAVLGGLTSEYERKAS